MIYSTYPFDVVSFHNISSLTLYRPTIIHYPVYLHTCDAFTVDSVSRCNNVHCIYVFISCTSWWCSVTLVMTVLCVCARFLTFRYGLDNFAALVFVCYCSLRIPCLDKKVKNYVYRFWLFYFVTLSFSSSQFVNFIVSKTVRGNAKKSKRTSLLILTFTMQRHHYEYCTPIAVRLVQTGGFAMFKKGRTTT